MHDTDTYGYDHWKINPKTKRRTRNSTRRAYAYAWRRYTDWCETEGRDPWDDPKGKTFAGFITAMTRAELKASTLRQCRAAIIYRYRTDPALHGRKDPTKTKRAKEAMAEIAELDEGRRKPQALEMTPDVMDRVLRASALRRSGEGHDAARLRHLEADATLRLMFDCALRVDDMARSEWTDLDARPDDNDNRTLFVRPGKTRHDRHAPVTPTTWAALQRWRAASPDPNGRISTASGPQALGQRIRRLGQFAGIPITGHSARRGRASSAARDGATEYDLMALGGWKSPAMANEYVKPLKANKVAARLYPNGDDHPEPEYDPIADAAANAPEALAYFTKILDNSTVLLPYVAGLSMAVALNASRDDPVVVHARDRLLELWPLPDPPRDCNRDDCPGFVLTADPRPDERWCSDRCRQIVRNEARRAARKAKT